MKCYNSSDIRVKAFSQAQEHVKKRKENKGDNTYVSALCIRYITLPDIVNTEVLKFWFDNLLSGQNLLFTLTSPQKTVCDIDFGKEIKFDENLQQRFFKEAALGRMLNILLSNLELKVISMALVSLK